jgi:uncharacterized protein (DUF2062 family)
MTVDVRPRARPRRHPVAKAYYRLRTRRDSPRQKALAVWLGVIVGCTPLFGLHLPMCIVLARIAGLSGVTTYLASYVNNPLVAPFTLYLSVGLGRLLFTGEWPALRMGYVHAAGVWHLGRDMLVGSLIVGGVLGGALAAVVYRFSSTHQERHALDRRIVDATARRYLDAGIYNWEFVQAKLKLDPVYFGILRANILPREGRLLDLGCGRGLLLAMLDNARKLYERGEWRSDWPTPPLELRLSGVDCSQAIVAIARGALTTAAELRVEDLADYAPTSSEVITLLDVLHYMSPQHQSEVLTRASRALRPGGLLLIRDADADGGLRFMLTRIAERLAAWCRGEWRQRFHYRSAREWMKLLESQGLAARVRPMSKGTPFANVLIEARKDIAAALD